MKMLLLQNAENVFFKEVLSVLLLLQCMRDAVVSYHSEHLFVRLLSVLPTE
jgi:hypothetical protein